MTEPSLAQGGKDLSEIDKSPDPNSEASLKLSIEKVSNTIKGSLIKDYVYR